ncbi:TonB-linked SusC/RagA family outer membrane protein [Filimonas zeae]|uniref:SusC/RagA family TonB-linked outer membrane protein n=1 Tax=Filimonas zeae TaxID=1737353 RepID=A0A917IS03_9BACT|nr:TonB-dependent receptor [Filimonas zeae]MDR6337953.1 TonB-linked SusC/RagA family outer membrane protein [Filimonas zeae]GGH61017.1 SusC/RagA family TonB-linked outer membrane protein [Filimonas zeae]
MKKLLASIRRLVPGANYVSQVLLIVLCMTALPTWAQQKVTGTVTDGKEPVADVSVTVKGSTRGVNTDSLGRFSITAASDAVLVFSHLSFGVKEVPVNGQSSVTVELTQLATSAGNEVVVVGYSSQKKATVTGSISVVKGSDLVKSPTANVSNAFAGRFSGMAINNRSGEPGYDGSSILIRGMATTGSNDVLVVVDGVPGQVGGLERLNPNDIESVSVLKDASAAIYGSRAANGVILVTTKRGKTGKPSISASFNQGFSSPTRLPKMADAATYATIRNEIEYWNNQAGGLNQVYSAEEIQKFANGSDPLNYPNTDWAKATLQNTTLQNQANISVSGGSENVKYFISGGTLYQDGLYKNGATKYKQYSFRSNIDANITNDFKVGLYLSGRQEDRKFPISSAGDIFRSIYRAYPTAPAIFPNGLPAYGIEGSNPVLMATDIGGTSENPRSVFNGILKASYNIAAVKGLSVDGFMAMDKMWNFTKTFSKPYLVYQYFRNSDTYEQRVTGGGADAKATLNQSQENVTQLTYNFKVNYNRNFRGHSVNAFVGYEQSEQKRDLFGAFRQRFPTITTPELSQGGTGAEDIYNTGLGSRYTRRSYIGKFGYSYQEKYLADVQMRIDGSSTFPRGKQYGYFPSVSAGWRISKESFFDVGFVNDLKLRASYGLLGNDNVAPFQYLNNDTLLSRVVLGPGAGVITPGVDLAKLANPNITWEEARKMDVGLEATLFNHFNVEVVYFQQKRSKILAPRNASIPNVTGIVNPYGSATLVPDENIGKVNSHGIEATLGYNNRSGDFTYGISGNFTYAANKIIFIDEAPGVLDHQKRTGRPVNTYLLYNAIGIYRTEAELTKYAKPDNVTPKLGDLYYEDFNGDGKITADDQIRSTLSNLPQITYGAVLNGGYKNFDLAIVLSGQSRVSQYVLPESGTVGNFYNTWAANRYSPTNPNGSYPRVDTRASNSPAGGQFKNNFWLNNASFLRLKSMELGYNLGNALLKRTGLQGARVYVNAFNLFTLTRVKDYDPEGSSESGQFYPQQRIINLGVNVRF